MTRNMVDISVMMEKKQKFPKYILFHNLEKGNHVMIPYSPT